MPKVSIIIPVYNVAPFLPRCLDSLVAQTLRDIEIICIDDKSTDNSLEILHEYAKKDNRIHIIASEKNGGVATARNRGIDIAKGEYIGFVDPDDYIGLSTIQKAYSQIKKEKSDILVFGCSEFNETSKSIRWDFELLESFASGEVPVTDKKKLLNLMHNIWDKIYSANFLRKNRILFIDRINISEDFIFNLQCISANAKFAFLAEPLYNYRVSNNGLSANPNSILNHIKAFIALNEQDWFVNSDKNTKNMIIKKFLDSFIYLQQRTKDTLKNKRKIRAFLSYCKKNRLIGDDMVKYYTKAMHLNNLLIKQLFSINKSDHGHCICCFGIKIHLKNKIKKKHIDKVYKHANKNSVMIFEAQPHHGECLPSYIKYFNDLGYHVDVFILKELFEQNPFCKLPKNLNYSLIEANWNNRYEILNNENLLKYKHILISTAICYYQPQKAVIQEFPIFKKHKSLLIVEHDLRDIIKNSEQDYLKQGNILTLWNFNKGTLMVNPCYFGDIKYTPKNDVTKFICVGNIEKKRKNHQILFQCIEKLLRTTTNFKVTIIGKIIDDFTIPEHLKPYIEVTGYLNFSEMFDYVEKADYFVPLLDSANKAHDRYVENGVSGSIQLILGFAKIPIIQKKFADFYGFNDTNALVYDNDFYEIMLNAVNMQAGQYSNLQNNLKNYAQNVYKMSIENLAKGIKE